MKQRNLGQFVAYAVAASLVVAACGDDDADVTTSDTTIDVPDDHADEFARASDDGKHVFYALADDVPTWESVAQAGIFVCSEDRPPLIPQVAVANLDGGGFQAGSLVTISGDSVMTQAGEQTLEEVTGVSKLIVTVPAAVDGCTSVALEDMMAEPGMLLMTDADASFPEEDQLVRVALE